MNVYTLKKDLNLKTLKQINMVKFDVNENVLNDVKHFQINEIRNQMIIMKQNSEVYFLKN